jgi:hypothetical protein
MTGESIMVGSLLLLGALVCFLLGVFIPGKRFDLVALGLAFWVMPQVLARFI